MFNVQGRDIDNQSNTIYYGSQYLFFHDIMDIHLTSHSWITRGSRKGFTKPDSFGTHLDDPLP